MPRAMYLGFIYLVVFITIALFANLLMSVGRVLFRYFQQMYLQSLNKNLENMFIFMSPTRILNISLMCMSLMFILTLVVTKINVTASVIMGAIGLLIPRIFIFRYMHKRKKSFDVQLVQGLEFLASSMKAGLSFIQALENLVENSMPPLSQEFDLLLREYRIGVPLNEALQNLARRVESEEINLMVFSTIITRELGGDISLIFENLAEVIRARQSVVERIETLTAQGKLQAMVCGAIPFLLYGILYIWKPELFATLVDNPVGRLGLYAVLFLQVTVVIIIRRMVDIDI